MRPAEAGYGWCSTNSEPPPNTSPVGRRLSWKEETRPVPSGAALLCWQTQALWLPGGLRPLLPKRHHYMYCRPARVCGCTRQGPCWPGSWMAAFQLPAQDLGCISPALPRVSDLQPWSPGGHRPVCSPCVPFHP